MQKDKGLDVHEAFNGPRVVEQSEWRVLTSLRSFQIIESVLKAYLCRKNCGGDDASSTTIYQSADVVEMPLGQLITHFKRVNKNVELHEQLQSVRFDRNLIAHQALVCQGNDLAEVIGVEAISLHMLKDIDLRAAKVMTAVVCEYIKTTPKNSA